MDQIHGGSHDRANAFRFLPVLLERLSSETLNEASLEFASFVGIAALLLLG